MATTRHDTTRTTLYESQTSLLLRYADDAYADKRSPTAECFVCTLLALALTPSLPPRQHRLASLTTTAIHTAAIAQRLKVEQVDDNEVQMRLWLPTPTKRKDRFRSLLLIITFKM
jgi:hypothetical protein